MIIIYNCALWAHKCSNSLPSAGKWCSQGHAESICVCQCRWHSLILIRLETHKKPVQQVLQRLLQHQLYVKVDMCDFHSSTVASLSHYSGDWSEYGLRECRVHAVKAWQTPTSRKKLQSFLDLAYFYQKFIENFSLIASPFHPKRINSNGHINLKGLFNF